MTHMALHDVFRQQKGVSVITAIFILLLLAGLAALMASVISAAHTTSAEDVLGVRAYQAARAGVEWGLYKVLENSDAASQTSVPAVGDCSVPVTLPGCPVTSFPAVSLDGFQVTGFLCEPLPGPAAADYYQEGCRRIRLFRLTATATGSGPNGLVIERQVQTTVEKCLDATTGGDC